MSAIIGNKHTGFLNQVEEGKQGPLGYPQRVNKTLQKGSAPLIAKETLGSYLSANDAQKILSKGVRKKAWLKAYSLDNKTYKERYTEDYLNKIISSLESYFNDDILKETAQLFKVNLQIFINNFKGKYFTSNYVALYYLALLDHRLNLIGAKLTTNHFKKLKDLPKITSRVFTYSKMKRIQSELYSAGIIRRNKRNDYYVSLRAKVRDFINFLFLHFSEYENKLRAIEAIVFQLIDYRLSPGVDYDNAAKTMVMTIASYYFDQLTKKEIWKVIEQNYGIDSKTKLLKATYRYRSKLKKKGFENDINALKDDPQPALEAYRKEQEFDKLSKKFAKKKEVYNIVDSLMSVFPNWSKYLLHIEEELYALLDEPQGLTIIEETGIDGAVMAYIDENSIKREELLQIIKELSKLEGNKEDFNLLRVKGKVFRRRLKELNVAQRFYPLKFGEGGNKKNGTFS